MRDLGENFIMGWGGEGWGGMGGTMYFINKIQNEKSSMFLHKGC